MATFQTQITHDGIMRHYKNIEPKQVISELVWNGFDAKARNINIILIKNELGGLEQISIIDDGVGIDIDNLSDNFGKFNDSSKTNQNEEHGSKGIGRLTFHKISKKAYWYTKQSLGKQARISITSDDLRNYQFDHITTIEQPEELKKQNSGTYVVIQNIFNNIHFNENELERYLSIEFGWFLSLNKNYSLKLNNQTIAEPEHKLYTRKETINEYDFIIKIIQWNNKPTSEKSFLYFLNENKKITFKKLSKFNYKANFFISAYIESNWFNSFLPKIKDLLSDEHEHNFSSDTFKFLENKCFEFISNIYDDFLQQFVDKKIEEFEEQGIFPNYDYIHNQEQREWRKNNTKNLVKEVYIIEPKIFLNLNKKQQKIIIHLLDKISISNENESLLEVLESVLELTPEKVDAFAKQLSHSKLENIISTIEVLQRRGDVIHKLREIMNHRYKEVLETPDLQNIIENNTWLFGNAYETLGAEETNFTNIAKNLRDKINNINDPVTQIDIEDENVSSLELEGAQRQVDLFIARKQKVFDSSGKQYYKCIIIEIKRPSISLNYKHLRQLEDYKRIIQSHSEFSSDNLRFELILIGRKISNNDTDIKGRLNSLKDRMIPGLVLDDDKFKCYVKNWYTLLDDFELSNSYLLDNLKLQRNSLEKMKTESLISDLQNKINSNV
ncbi:ATP-binding protein [Actinobacillus equuli subsp. haemolyticus]|uniref:ATP-binding protein n=1 Tax=Actinobacillus equuli TaxID=718 RepID=UPI002442B54D|nr:ATP-binding protein [Actinobacillus equuli]WGE71952.1 ATP-binding protein [Actinobacillus equuli subsp. haemolyticus]